jgi:hypothetical protein
MTDMSRRRDSWPDGDRGWDPPRRPWVSEEASEALSEIAPYAGNHAPGHLYTFEGQMQQLAGLTSAACSRKGLRGLMIRVVLVGWLAVLLAEVAYQLLVVSRMLTGG